jgi:hypothetical protein
MADLIRSNLAPVARPFRFCVWVYVRFSDVGLPNSRWSLVSHRFDFALVVWAHFSASFSRSAMAQGDVLLSPCIGRSRLSYSTPDSHHLRDELS